MTKQYSEKQKEILSYLNEIPDPEIPIISIVELGVVRNVNINDGKVEIDLTPTYSGCPAIHSIESDIVSTLHEKGYDKILINRIYNPPWTTDWISKESKLKLKKYGIAPPESSSELLNYDFGHHVRCPFCNSDNTTMKNWFGSTPCKSLYYCNDCSQPFEKFKSF